MTHHDGTAHDENTTHEDEIEEKEDQREEAQLDASLAEGGLLPVPEATPADGQAPAA